MDSNYSLADIRAVTGDNDRDSWGGDGGWFWIVVLFLFMFGFGGNGLGFGNNGALTRAELADGFNFQDINGQLRGIQQGLCDGFYSQNNTMLQGLNGIQRDLCTGFSNVAAGIAENRYASQQCCCETNRNIDSLRYDGQKNTCEITNAIHAEGEQTRALINANTVQALRDKLVEKDQMLQSRDFQLSQLSQTSTIVDQLRNYPCGCNSCR